MGWIGGAAIMPDGLFELDWAVEGRLAGRALLATILGAVMGWERQRHGREAGTRTFGAVALGSCMFSLVSSHISAADPARIAANIVTGIGFLGAGIIFRAGDRTVGLTTAATLWATAAVGMAVGFGMYPLAILGSILTFAVLALHHLPGWAKPDSGERADFGVDIGSVSARGRRANE